MYLIAVPMAVFALVYLWQLLREDFNLGCAVVGVLIGAAIAAVVLFFFIGP